MSPIKDPGLNSTKNINIIERKKSSKMKRLLILIFTLFYGEIFNAKNEATVYDDSRPITLEDCDLQLNQLISQFQKSRLLGPSRKIFVDNDFLGLLDF